VNILPADPLSHKKWQMPRSPVTITPGPLPPLSIRYICEWARHGPIHESDVPIE